MIKIQVLLTYQVYVCRGTSENSMQIQSYQNKVQPFELKIQIVVGEKFIYPITKKKIVHYIQTDNLKVLPKDDQYTVLDELLHNSLIKYQEKIQNMGQGSGLDYNSIEDLAINFRKTD